MDMGVDVKPGRGSERFRCLCRERFGIVYSVEQRCERRRSRVHDALSWQIVTRLTGETVCDKREDFSGSIVRHAFAAILSSSLLRIKKRRLLVFPDVSCYNQGRNKEYSDPSPAIVTSL